MDDDPVCFTSEERMMKTIAGTLFALMTAVSHYSAIAQGPPRQQGEQGGGNGAPHFSITGLPTKTTFVALGQGANAVLVEPVTLNEKSHIAVLITHPERANNFNYFIGQELPKYGYRAMMLNYYGKEQTYYEFIPPLAAAIKALLAIPGVDKVVLAGHSSGGAELSSYQDVAENGPAACQGPDRVYKCPSRGLDNLPKAAGIMLVDANTGAADKTMALNPAVNEFHPRDVDPALDMYNPKNGYDPATHSATYSDEFLTKFFAAQAAKANRVIDEAQDRLTKIEKGEGDYKDDEPFVVAGAGINNSGARLELADMRLMQKTHSPHPLLMPDGTKVTRIIERTLPPEANPYGDLLSQTTQDVTVRHYLSFQGLRVTSDYRMTPDNLLGIKWRSTPNSLQGNLEGIKVPTFIIAATCNSELTLLEISYEHSIAKDKEFIGVQGADHNFQPCKAEYGNTYQRAFDYMDGWLSKPGRL
jgi:pimeloyl-ACP methyl ester carboxylesterase